MMWGRKGAAVPVLAAVVMLAGAFALALGCRQAGAQVPLPVDVELVLTVDGSASVSGGVMDFQIRGHAAALRDPRVAAAIGAGRHGAVAITLVRFAGPGTLEVLVPWTRVSDAAEAVAFAGRMADEDRPARDGSTALGSAILDALALFEGNGFEGGRKVVDLVSNGFSNSGIAVEEARDRAEAAGVTVNGLAILDEYDWLEDYFVESVIAGPGAFVRTAETRESFAQAVLGKLIDEIVEAPATAPAATALAFAQERRN